RALERLVTRRTAEVRAQADELAALDDIVDAINRHVEMPELLGALLEKAVVLFPQAEKAVFLFIDHERRSAEVVAAIGYESEPLQGVRLSSEEIVSRSSAPT